MYTGIAISTLYGCKIVSIIAWKLIKFCLQFYLSKHLFFEQLPGFDFQIFVIITLCPRNFKILR